jgi:deoxycytidine triphosphate deaminase
LILCDRDIRKLAVERGMIAPFVESHQDGVISFGCTHSGYDMRLGPKYKVFKNTHNVPVDPKRMKEPGYASRFLEDCEADAGGVIVVPAHTYILGYSLEYFSMPNHLSAIAVGKSTLARCGIIVNCTPLEPGWCAADDTEALTPDGWVFLKDVAVGDRLLTRKETGDAEFRSVVAKQEMDWDGDLLHFAGRSVDQLVTPEHNLFVHRRTSPFNVVTERKPAHQVFGRHNYSFDRQVVWRGEEPLTIDVAGRSWDAGDFLEFYGSWLGDGSAYHGTDAGYHVKLAVVTREEKRRRFGDVLQRLKIKHSLHERGYHFYDKELRLWLMQHGHAHDKFIRRDVLHLGPALLSRLVDGLMQSDGCVLTNTYTTASRRLADDVQEAIFKCGRAAIVRDVTETFRGVRSRRYIVRDCDDHMTPKMKPDRHRLMPYKGKVYDVTVPNHVFLCRRDGKVSWTGNCGHLTIEIANVTPCPVHLYANEGCAQVRFELLTGVPDTDYSQKGVGGGKYQGQAAEPVPARIIR